MKSYTHFTLSERNCLQQLLSEGRSYREIAKILDRSPSTISREVKRNFSQKKKQYNAWRATTLYIIRRRQCVRKPAIIAGSKLYLKIVECLEQYWSPELTAKHCKDKGYSICFSTIYRAVKNGAFEDIKPKTHLRRKGKKKHAKRGNHATIHPEHTIHDRPDIVDKWIRIGDWEGDTVCGAKNKSCLVTQVDRVSKLLTAAISPNHTKEAVRLATKKAFELLPKNMPIYTITLDNGSEFADFKGIEKDLKTTIYFADPHSPWQRGLNENTNDMLRFFFPKGTDFSKITEQELMSVLNLINNRPRKCLDYISPLEFVTRKCCT